MLMDALAEFQSHRGPTPMAYVNRRYPIRDEYGWMNREQKAAQVERRCKLAEAARMALEWTA